MEALIVVDGQNDFIAGGALAVPGGDAVIPLVNGLQANFQLIAATRDWHPPDHGSFAANHPGKHPGDLIELEGLKQTLWPVHCVQNTPGADFAPGLNRDRWAKVVLKGTDANIDSYSGFYDNGHRKATGLGEYLRRKGVSTVFIAGLAHRLLCQVHRAGCTGLGVCNPCGPGLLPGCRSESGRRGRRDQ